MPNRWMPTRSMPIRWMMMLWCVLLAVRPAPGAEIGAEPGGAGPLRLAVVGLVHGHVDSLLELAQARDGLEIVGVWDPDRSRFDRLKGPFGLDDALYFDDLGAMLDQTRPEAASVMTSTLGHLAAVRACAPRGVHVMVERPLAVTPDHARIMIGLSQQHGTLLLTNYGISGDASLLEANRITRDGAWATPIRRAVFRHGHRGPAETGAREEYLAWLTSPVQNGAGALFDFGGYGALLMTWLMDGQRPMTVRAVTRTLKPGLYPRVDDDATIVLTYPDAVGVVQASWSWTHEMREMDVYTDEASIHCAVGRPMTVRRADEETATAERAALHPDQNADGAGASTDEWAMFASAVRGEADPDPRSMPELNLIVVQILDAARRSAQSGESVVLKRE